MSGVGATGTFATGSTPAIISQGAAPFSAALFVHKVKKEQFISSVTKEIFTHGVKHER